jgi:hypothetical protein
MRIAFVTGRLQPGSDGVGDYVRRLAAECVRQGHAVALVALAEMAADGAPAEGIEPWPTFRRTLAQNRRDGGRAARDFVAGFAPDWTSLHFVPYSFHPRGFFAAVIPLLIHVGRSAPRRHVFFHEIWIGAAVGASWRARLTGRWQRRAVGELLRRLEPALVHTSMPYNQGGLEMKLGQPTGLMPMFGAVPRWSDVAPAQIPGIDDADLVAGMFGALHPNWEAEAFLADFAAMANESNRPPVLVAAGALRYGVDFFARIADRWGGRVRCVALGEHAPDQLARIFARFDFAVTSVPWNLIGKSSSAAALREHGLRVVVTNPGEPPRFSLRTERLVGPDPGFVPYFRDHALLRSALDKTVPMAGVERTAARFLAELGNFTG